MNISKKSDHLSDPIKDKGLFSSRSWLAPQALLISLVLLFFGRFVFSNLILARGDVLLYFYPYWQAAAESLRAGHLPLWNPNLFMGVPFLANSQVGVLYPLNWPLWLIFSTPDTIKTSIVIHVIIAGSGTYFAARRSLSLSKEASLLSAILFSLGGYFTAQVEHVNQLQGLSWLPWIIAVVAARRPIAWDRRSMSLAVIVLAPLLALQILAGHAQTTFISIIGLFLWLSFRVLSTEVADPRFLQSRFPVVIGKLLMLIKVNTPLFFSLILGGIISAAQIIPTIELMLNSSRQGGLSFNEALSFSLHPISLTQSLLPGYTETIYSEYVAFLPLSALLMAFVGIRSSRARPEVLSFVLLAAAGIFLALGAFNPIYRLLVHLPGFNLFRVPARWLVLYAFSIALLAGIGWDTVASQLGKSRFIHRLGSRDSPLLIGSLLLVAIMVWGILAVPISKAVPIGKEVTPTFTPPLTWLGWVVELLLFYLILANPRGVLDRRWHLSAVYLLTIATLFFATRELPYNRLSTPEVFSDLRPPIAIIRTQNDCGGLDAECTVPMDRLLSLSDVFFDVGDQPELDSIYQSQLSEEAQYDYTVSIKLKEILSPNLPLAYKLASVDGFDGGLLPLKNYSQLMKVLLPPGLETTDGRLRENLNVIPDHRWLDLFNARYIITDKTGDIWRQEVFFDRQHVVDLTERKVSASVGFLPSFVADELWLLSVGHPGYLRVVDKETNEYMIEPLQIEDNLYKVILPAPAELSEIQLRRDSLSDRLSDEDQGTWSVSGLTLVNSHDGSFYPLSLGNYRLIYSGNVKIYENLDVLPRAFLIYDWQAILDEDASIAAMQEEEYVPSQKAIIHTLEIDSPTGPGNGTVEYIDSQSERLKLRINSDKSALLVMNESYYPGWKAFIDGQETPIYRTDVLFRGIKIPEGEHTVDVVYKPWTVQIGLYVSLGGVLLWIASLIQIMRRKRLDKKSNHLASF